MSVSEAPPTARHLGGRVSRTRLSSGAVLPRMKVTSAKTRGDRSRGPGQQPAVNPRGTRRDMFGAGAIKRGAGDPRRRGTRGAVHGPPPRARRRHRGQERSRTPWRPDVLGAPRASGSRIPPATTGPSARRERASSCIVISAPPPKRPAKSSAHLPETPPSVYPFLTLLRGNFSWRYASPE